MRPVTAFAEPRCRQMRGRAGEHGKMLLGALLLTAVVTTSSMYLDHRLTQAANIARSESLRTDMSAVADLVERSIDCRNSIQSVNTAFTPSNPCPEGTVVNFWFEGRSAAEPQGAPNASTFLANASIPPGSKWRGTLSCGSSSLHLQLALVNSTTGAFVSDPLRGQKLDFNNTEGEVAGDRPAERQLCPEWFGGAPNSRLYTLSMDTAQATSMYTGGSQNYIIFSAGGRCDGTVGLMASWIFNPTLCGPPDNLAPECVVMQGILIGECGITTAPPLNPAQVSPTCQGPPVYGRSAGDNSCNAFCVKTAGYTVGHMVKCDPVNGVAMAFGAYTPDSAEGQQTCLCLK